LLLDERLVPFLFLKSVTYGSTFLRFMMNLSSFKNPIFIY